MIWLYIMCSPDRDNFLVGTTSDLKKAISFFKEMPSLKPENKIRLVYLEGYETQADASIRFKEVSALTKDIKIQLVQTINPEFVEMVPGKNVEI